MPRKSRKNVGLIGLGIIGTRVAAALRSGGYHVFVWNRSPKPEPNFLSSPAEIAEVCDVIQLFVSDAQALFDVIDSFIDHLTPQHTIICSATVGPEATVEAAKVVHARGAKFVDAPFTGSRGAAENRQLVYFTGGDEETLKKVEPILKTSSKAIVKIGDIGQAATIKVVTNMLAAVTVQTLAEVHAITKKSGISDNSFVEALQNHGIRSPILDLKTPAIVTGDYDTHFSLKHMFKDIQLGIHLANALELDVPASTTTAGVMYGCLSQGWGDMDFSVLGKIYEEQLAENTDSAEEAGSEEAKPTSAPDKEKAVTSETKEKAASSKAEPGLEASGKSADAGTMRSSPTDPSDMEKKAESKEPVPSAKSAETEGKATAQKTVERMVAPDLSSTEQRKAPQEEPLKGATGNQPLDPAPTNPQDAGKLASQPSKAPEVKPEGEKKATEPTLAKAQEEPLKGGGGNQPLDPVAEKPVERKENAGAPEKGETSEPIPPEELKKSEPPASRPKGSDQKPADTAKEEKLADKVAEALAEPPLAEEGVKKDEASKPSPLNRFRRWLGGGED